MQARCSIIMLGLTILALAAACGTAAFPTGKFHIAEAPDYTYEFTPGGAIIILHAFGDTSLEDSTGKYRLSGNQVIFYDDTFCGNAEGAYNWTYDGKALRFTVVSDACGDRLGALTYRDFLPE